MKVRRLLRRTDADILPYFSYCMKLKKMDKITFVFFFDIRRV